MARERARVGSTPPHSHLLLLKDLTKVRAVGPDPAPSLALGAPASPVAPGPAGGCRVGSTQRRALPRRCTGAGRLRRWTGSALPSPLGR